MTEKNVNRFTSKLCHTIISGSSFLLFGCPLPPVRAVAQQASITPKEATDIRYNLERRFGATPTNPGLKMTDLSGSSYITFVLAWGVNHGIPGRVEYESVIREASAGLVHQIYIDGRLDNVQQTGAAPVYYHSSSNFNYGVGGYLFAG